MDNLASLMISPKMANGKDKFDIMNITLLKDDYGIVQNSQSLFKSDYGLLIINREGAGIFVQNPKDNETQFLTTAAVAMSKLII